MNQPIPQRRAYTKNWWPTFYWMLSGALLLEWLALVHIAQIQSTSSDLLKNLAFFAISLFLSFISSWGPGIVVGLIVPGFFVPVKRTLPHRLAIAIFFGAMSAAVLWYGFAYANV